MEKENIKISLRAKHESSLDFNDEREILVYATRGEVAEFLDEIVEKIETAFEIKSKAITD